MKTLQSVREDRPEKTGEWCNGSTTSFGLVCPGSSPGSSST